ncbi:MAG TPA: MgtC/SapB family protein [bacterium]|nr:MgtC/SapB family protein [bacterium]
MPPPTLTAQSPDFLVLMERVGISLAIGMMVGMEREWAHKEVGVRTFAFVGLAFTLAWTISPIATYILMVTLIPLVTLLNWRSLTRDGTLELTTTVALLATALLGILVGQGLFLMAAACGVVITVLLAWKSEVVRFTGALTNDEIRGALILGVIALVVYPILPQGTIDPWHLIDLRSAWTVVLVISAIAFTNYVLLRIYGTRGIRWTGLLGGLVNSTATVAELASRARNDPAQLSVFALLGMATANTAMLLRNGLILGVFDVTALSHGWLSIVLMVGVSAIIMYRLHVQDTTTPPLRMQSPISVRHALMFGALFLLITVAGELANRLFGQTGFLIVAAVGGLVSSASTSAAAGILAAKGALAPQLAGHGVVVTSMASLIFHVPMAQMAGRNQNVTRRLARLSALILAAGVAGLVAEAVLPVHH